MSAISSRLSNFPLRWRLGLVSVCFLLLVGGSALATYLTAQSQANDGRVINLAGRLRMLTQRTALLALVAPGDAEIERLAGQIESTLWALRAGGTVSGPADESLFLPGGPDPGLAVALSQAEAAWAAYRPLLPGGEQAAILAGSQQVVAGLEQVTAAYEQRAAAKVARLLAIQKWFLAAGLLLAAAGYLVFQSGVLRPLQALGRAAAQLGAGALEQPVPDLGGAEIGQLAQHFEQMRWALQHNQAELRRQLERQGVMMAERQRLAADLHDNLAQTLSFVRLKIEANQLERALSTLDQAYCQLRAALVDLHDPPASGCDLVEKLVECTAEFQNQTGLAVQLELGDADCLRLSRLAQEQALHIVREGLNNIRRHAGAGRVALALRADPAANGAWLSLNDDGCGFCPGQNGSGHLGLKIMQTRAQRSGGRLEIQSAPGAGTRLCLFLPTNLESMEEVS